MKDEPSSPTRSTDGLFLTMQRISGMIFAVSLPELLFFKDAFSVTCVSCPWPPCL
jgi:hypothetical protein